VVEPFIYPDWPALPGVRALATTRSGGVSLPPYDSLNLGDHVGDAPATVAANRAMLRKYCPAEPKWLKQVHGVTVANADSMHTTIEADASVAFKTGTVCAVLTADCLPVLFCNHAGSVVAAAHAGWRGLAAGVLESTVNAMKTDPAGIMAWLGPAIGPQAFEVGDEVREAFVSDLPETRAAFKPGLPGKWLADIYLLARLRLARAGVNETYGGGFCTLTDQSRFFSFRRDQTTGRMASLIWIE
jgi:hypothetical protein